MFQRLLVPLDGSPHAEQALPTAARIVRASGGTLLLVRVIDLSIDPILQFPEPLINVNEISEIQRARATTYLEEIVASDVIEGLRVETRIIEGKPVQAILSVAHTMLTDLIVMSSHRYTGLKRWVLGSVAQHIERHSSIPVLILPNNATVSEQSVYPDRQPTRVIVPLDGTALSEAALPVAASLSRVLSTPARGMLHLVMVLPHIHLANITVGGVYTQAIHDAQEYLASIVQTLCLDHQVASSIEVTSSILLQSTIATALLELIATKAKSEGSHTSGTDVIAMATHGREGLDRWFHSSVTEHVLDASTFPVLVLHPEHSEVYHLKT